MGIPKENTSESHIRAADPECVICGSGGALFLFPKNGYRVFRCRTCGVEFLYPQPPDHVLEGIYGPDYFLRSDSEAGAERIARMKGATAALYLDRIGRHLPTTRGRLLEIGCGMGDLLVEAQHRGFEVRGVEVSASSAAEANRRLGGVFVHGGTLETSDLTEGSFDVIVGCDVLEHVRNPEKFLCAAHGLLRPQGIIFLVTPSTDSFLRWVLGHRWMEYKTEHLFYFNKASIRSLLRRSAFEPVAMDSNRKVLSLDYINRHFERFPVAGVSPVLNAACRVLPEPLLFRNLTVPASGLLVIARKLSAPEVS